MRAQDERGRVELAVKRAEELAVKRADKNAKNEVASKMKQKGLPFNDIADFTGLSLEEIEGM